jgi:hypothetical protein
MKHISFFAFTAMGDDGQFKLPVIMHQTYCRKAVSATEIDSVHPTCEECMDSKIWEEIDRREGYIV